MTALSVTRLADGPIVTPRMDARMGDNVNGPSLIRVPEWVPSPLGRYYLYFAHHDGQYIRLAYADELTGPWRTHEPGVLPIARSGFAGHIASPDVHVDDDARRIRMYFHGSDTRTGGPAPQFSRVALSTDGLDFEALPADLGPPYFRVIHHRGHHYALAMPGLLLRSRDGLTDFEAGPQLFDDDMRHSALLVEGERLLVFYTHVGDEPERILLAEVALDGEWHAWREGPSTTILAPEHDYEGANAPSRPSVRGIVHGPVNELRDPCVFREDGQLYLLYSVAGENGIALARIDGLDAR